MVKSELIEVLADKTFIPSHKAGKIIDEIFGSMTDTLAAGGRIEIRGFGSFEIRCFDSYDGRNPKPGELMAVKPKKSPFFNVGKDLRERIMAYSSDAS